MGKPQSQMGLLLGGLGIGALGLVIFSRREAVTQAASELLDEAQEALEESVDWVQKVIGRVSQHEGRHDSLNLNADGAGLSFGILQWAQKPGALGELLQLMYEASPNTFITTFGEHYRALLQVTAAGSLEPVGGVVLWQEPWVSRFRQAGRTPVFIEVQNRLAAEGDHFKGALEAAQLLGLVTERSVALMYDTAVQQGAGFARQLARRIHDRYAGQTLPMAELLTAYAQAAPAHFRRTAAPTEPYPVAHIEWRQVGPSEWHAWAGRFNLYTGILKRRMGIVGDPALADVPLQTAGV